MDILLQLTAQQVLNYKHKKLVHYSLYQIIKKKKHPNLSPHGLRFNTSDEAEIFSNGNGKWEQAAENQERMLAAKNAKEKSKLISQLALISL